MNKIFFSVLTTLLLMSSTAKSQDTIKLKTGITLYGLITAVNGKEIQFKIDGGAVAMEQVVSYNKSGKSMIVKNTGSNLTQSSTSTEQLECQIKNFGDALFDNRTDDKVEVHILSNSTPAILDEKLNPTIAVITVPARSKQYAYDLSAGVHYIWYNNGYGTGQVKVIKCDTINYVIQ